jgi:hypothetical protein
MIPLEDLLRNLGFDAVQAAVWKQFIVAVVYAVRSAGAQICEPQEWNGFAKKDGALSKAKPRSRKSAKNKPLPVEEGITQQLYFCLKQIVRAAGEAHALKLLQISFETEAPVELPDRTGTSSKWIDLLATSNLSPTAPVLVFEAKVLTIDSDIEQHYLHSERGIGRFARQIAPYTKERLGAMLTYVVAGDTQRWTKAIQSKMIGPPPWAKSFHYVIIEGEADPVFCSQLERKHVVEGDIAVFHFAMRIVENVASGQA